MANRKQVLFALGILLALIGAFLIATSKKNPESIKHWEI